MAESKPLDQGVRILTVLICALINLIAFACSVVLLLRVISQKRQIRQVERELAATAPKHGMKNEIPEELKPQPLTPADEEYVGGAQTGQEAYANLPSPELVRLPAPDESLDEYTTVRSGRSTGAPASIADRVIAFMSPISSRIAVRTCRPSSSPTSTRSDKQTQTSKKGRSENNSDSPFLIVTMGVRDREKDASEARARPVVKRVARRTGAKLVRGKATLAPSPTLPHSLNKPVSPSQHDNKSTVVQSLHLAESAPRFSASSAAQASEKPKQEAGTGTGKLVQKEATKRPSKTAFKSVAQMAKQLEQKLTAKIPENKMI